MNWFEALLLGIVVGLFEFLPISTSAHLLVVESLLGKSIHQQELTALLQLAMLLAVISYFFKEVYEIIIGGVLYLIHKNNKYFQQFAFIVLIFFTTGVFIILGSLFERIIIKDGFNVATTGVSLVISGLILILIEHGIPTGTRTVKELTWRDGMIIGFGQSLSVLPGISRTGSSLVIALWCGIEKETAIRYSLLLSIPFFIKFFFTELNANTLSKKYVLQAPFEAFLVFFATFLFAIISIKLLIAIVKNTKLTYFAVYSICLGVIIWICVSFW